jgi:putative restriction endonuclease
MFASRNSLFASGVHRDNAHDICANAGTRLAESVLISDTGSDFDLGDIVYFRGVGGSPNARGELTADQVMEGANGRLAANVSTQIPVRVVRTTRSGYRYDGLFRVESAWMEPGREQHLVCRFRLTREVGFGNSSHESSRRLTTTYRLVRDGAVAQEVKRIHDYTCQFCAVRLETATGPYAEGAHIVPLAANGSDDLSNIMCLCPNDHMLFDHGSLQIADDWTVRDRAGLVRWNLRRASSHAVSLENIRAHRSLLGFPADPGRTSEANGRGVDVVPS